jgi:hypothetical protein
MVCTMPMNWFTQRASVMSCDSCSRAKSCDASVAVCGFEYGLRQLSALGLTAHRVPVTGT